MYKTESVVSEHMLKQKHNFDWENVKICDREPIYKKRLISEMIHINLNSHTINRKKDVETLSRVYSPLWQCFGKQDVDRR